MGSYPVQEILPALLQDLASASSVIVQAPPGAGKTTVIPLELLKHFPLDNKKIVMLEPRRLAATNAARWMAHLLGEEVGETVGYTIRFDRRVSAATRIEVVTEGILSRRLYNDPLLKDTGIIIFDEFHERNIHSDLGLALCHDLQQGLRNDLRILVMSATLDGASVSRILDGAPVISSAGRSYPVEIQYAGDHAPETMTEAVARSVRLALQETEGDVLVFLPGAGEIRAVQRDLDSGSLQPAPLIVPLYGDLPFAAQETAILPSKRRKVVLATNIAETSLTIEGVRVVIDSGWVRQLRFDHSSGLSRLYTARVSAASADQRAGRAGRIGPGTCYRLWSEHTQRTLVPHASPEIHTADLSPLVLDLASWGIVNPDALQWVDPPAPAAVAAAKALLIRLNALDASGVATRTGIRMGSLPMHPRLAHMLLYAVGKGWGSLGAVLAALLSEKDILRAMPVNARRRTDSDMVDRLEAFSDWQLSQGNRDETVDTFACRTVERVAKAFCKSVGISFSSCEADIEKIGILLAAAYPDRLAQKRDNSDSYLLANGRGASLSPRSAVGRPAHLVAVSVEDGDGGNGLIHSASSIDITAVRREFPRWFEKRRIVYWDSHQGKICAREEEKLEALVVSSKQVSVLPDEVCAGLLDAVRSEGLGILQWSDAAVRFRDRVRFLARYFPGEWPDLSDAALLANLDQWLKPWLMNNKPAASSRLDIFPALQAWLSFEQLRKMEGGVPSHLTVPSGSRISLDYSGDGPPVLAVKLQELFGLSETPTVGWGRVPVVLHLLSPARRPLQVTQDLRSFWNSGYREVKKELKGRYPKHPWPDDPWNAVPTRHTKSRRDG